jgi:sugar lactone lactonase YvrE
MMRMSCTLLQRMGATLIYVFCAVASFSGAALARTFIPGNGGPDGMHYDVRGNLWAALAGLGGIIQIDRRGIILGFVPIPKGDTATTNFAFGGAVISTSTWRERLAGPSGASRRPIRA